jgi:hypothetical protein
LAASGTVTVGSTEARERRGRSRRDNMMNGANIYSEEKMGEREKKNREERNKVYLFIEKETDKNMSRQMMFSN